MLAITYNAMCACFPQAHKVSTDETLFWWYGRYPSLTRLRWWDSWLLFGILRIAFQETWSPQRNMPPHLDSEVHSLSFSLARRSTRKRRRRRRSMRKKFKRIRMSMRYFLHRYHRHHQFPSKQDLLGQGVGWLGGQFYSQHETQLSREFSFSILKKPVKKEISLVVSVGTRSIYTGCGRINQSSPISLVP